MTLEVEPVTTVVGARVSGLDLRAPLAEADRRAIHAALLEHGVLFFRDQPLEPAELVAFARRFGEISLPPMAPDSDLPREVMVLDQVSPRGEGADGWHSDNTFMPEPPMGSILRAVRLPRLGGDTCFASAVAAYEALSPPMRGLVDGLVAEHDIAKPMARAVAAGIFPPERLESARREWPPVRHPVVRTHPETGRRALFVNANSTTRLLDLPEREGALLLPFLIDHVRSPDFQCRFRWEEGSIAFWDNRTVQHYAVPDYTERRIMHRVTLAGDRPV